MVERAMPILESLGPSPRRPPPPAAPSPRLSPAARKLGVLPMPSLEWNDTVARETAHLYARIKNVVPSVEWPFFATYVNTSAEVKAESDICCTSSNAVMVVESLGAERVIFLPDEYLAKYVASQTHVKIIAWKGHCEVHERFTADELQHYREADPSI